MRKRLKINQGNINKINFEANELNFLFGGYFSAIGKININQRRIGKKKWNSYTLYITLSFQDLKIAKLFQKNFGGNIQIQTFDFPEHWRKPKVKRTLARIHWGCVSSHAIEFLTSIETYMIDNKKIKQIKLARKYWYYQQKNLNLQSEAVRKQKHKYYLQMRALR